MDTVPYTAYSDSEPVITSPPVQMTSPISSNSHTTVIVQQPSLPMIKPPRLWATKLMDCCDDMGICLCGTFCGSCLASQIATDMGESACVPCCVPGAMIALRIKWRTQENIQGSLMDDCCTLLCCGPCALCQMAREIKFKRDGVLMSFPS